MKRLVLLALCCLPGCNQPGPAPVPTPPPPVVVPPPPIVVPPPPPPPVVPLPPPTPEPVMPEVVAQLYILHNDIRRDRQLPDVEPRPQLQLAAQKHAQWMADNNVMSHTGENSSTFVQRVTAAGYKMSSGGENVAAGYKTPESVMQGWMASPGHRRNILNDTWLHMGAGMAERNGKRFWCTVFARPNIRQKPTASTPSEAGPGDVSLPEPLEADEP